MNPPQVYSWVKMLSKCMNISIYGKRNTENLQSCKSLCIVPSWRIAAVDFFNDPKTPPPCRTMTTAIYDEQKKKQWTPRLSISALEPQRSSETDKSAVCSIMLTNVSSKNQRVIFKELFGNAGALTLTPQSNNAYLCLKWWYPTLTFSFLSTNTISISLDGNTFPLFFLKKYTACCSLHKTRNVAIVVVTAASAYQAQNVMDFLKNYCCWAWCKKWNEMLT